MLKCFYILFLFFFASVMFSQKGLVFVRDLNTNEIDTLNFGYNDLATIGIDSVLKEKNIRSKKLESLDVRILQRDTQDFYCLHPFKDRVVQGNTIFDSIFYSPSFDSKVNFRPPSQANRYFEFYIHRENRIRFTFDFDMKFGNFFDRIVIYKRDCPNVTPIFTFGDSLVNNTESMIFNIFDTSQYHLIFVFKDTISIPNIIEDEMNETFINYYPNPFTNYLNINLLGEYSFLEIIDASGKLYLKDTNLIGNNIYSIVTTDWPYGFYFIRLVDVINRQVVVRKIIKPNQ